MSRYAVSVARVICAGVCASTCLLSSQIALAACSIKYWTSFKGTDVFRTADSAAYFYRTKRVAIDADGAPNAYHPDDIGLDYLANAGYPSTSWWPSVLVQDPAKPSQPLVRKDGPFAGYFISKTSLQSPKLAETEPGKFVDATAVPYLVFPTQWAPMKGSGGMGDFAMAKSTSASLSSAAIVADSGGGKDASFGEMSIKLAELLGAGEASPRKGPSKPLGEIMYVVFPQSRDTPRWPVTNERMRERAEALLGKVGGWPDPNCLKR